MKAMGGVAGLVAFTLLTACGADRRLDVEVASPPMAAAAPGTSPAPVCASDSAIAGPGYVT